MNSLRKTIFLGAFLFLGLSPVSSIAQTAKIIKPSDLFKEPSSIGSNKSGSLSQGQSIIILEKKGFWVKIDAGGQIGWLKLNDIELPNSLSKYDPLLSGRTASGNIVNTAGARGLSPEELKNSNPNPRAVDQAIQNSLNISEAIVSQFISSGGITERSSVPEIMEIKTTISGNVSKSEIGTDSWIKGNDTSRNGSKTSSSKIESKDW